MDRSNIFLESLRGNPYGAELTEIVRATKRDPQSVPELFRALEVKINDDVIEERTTLQSRLARLNLLSGFPGTQAQLVQDLTSILEDWFDVAARRHLVALAWTSDPRPYIDLLPRLVEQQAEMLDLASQLLGEETVKLVMNARVAHWTIEAKAQAQRARESKAGAIATNPDPAPLDQAEARDNIGASAEQQEETSPQNHDPDSELVRRVIAEVGIESFLAEHSLKKTSVTDYTGGRATGRVSKEKQREIIEAARKTAVDLGLTPRINSE